MAQEGKVLDYQALLTNSTSKSWSENARGVSPRAFLFIGNDVMRWSNSTKDVNELEPQKPTTPFKR